MSNNHFILLLLMFSLVLVSCQKERLLPESAVTVNLLADCPNIEPFVKEHFPDLSIRKIEQEKKGNQRIYDVYLTGDVELEFSEQCDIIEIETENGIPHSALMPGIVAYVMSNFPNSMILEWELYPNYQEIKLNDGREIKFDLSGQLYSGDSETCTAIQSFVETHFPTHSIVKIEMEDDDDRIYYDVYLTDGVELEFNLQCSIIDIETINGVPYSALSTRIVEYVEANYPDNVILEWELYLNYQKVYLNNDLEIIFDLDGNFIRIDD